MHTKAAKLASQLSKRSSVNLVFLVSSLAKLEAVRFNFPCKNPSLLVSMEIKHIQRYSELKEKTKHVLSNHNEYTESETSLMFLVSQFSQMKIPPNHIKSKLMYLSDPTS